MKRFWFILAAFLGLAVQAVPASADIVYTLNCNNDAACASPGNFGTVTLSTPVDINTVHVSVQLASGFQFGGNNTNALLWNGLTSDALTSSNVTSGFGPIGSIPVGTYAASPFTASGTFDYRIQRSNNSGSPTALTFDVTKSGGLALTNFTTDFAGGFFFAAQIRTTASSTMFYVASNSPGVRVPEPGSLTLSIAGLIGLTGLIMLQRRRKLVRAV